MTIVLITGAYPPKVCGVGDYTRHVFEAGRPGVWALHASGDWRLGSLTRHLSAIRRLQADTVVLQYPTQGYGWSLVPHLLGICLSLKRGVTFAVALHEFSQLSIKARLPLWLLLLFVQGAVFTTAFEAEFAVRALPRLRWRSALIPIKHNIDPAPVLHDLQARYKDVCYFGQIRPNKGVEQFVAVAKSLLARRSDLSVSLIGQVPAGYEPFLESVREAILGTTIRIVLDSPPKDVARLLNEHKLAYLPFPDGVSERRGSFLAALSNGLPVISNGGRFTSDGLRSTFVEAGKDPVAAILATLEDSSQAYAQRQERGLRYLRDNVPLTWCTVAQMYEEFAQRLTRSR